MQSSAWRVGRTSEDRLICMYRSPIRATTFGNGYAEMKKMGESCQAFENAESM